MRDVFCEASLDTPVGPVMVSVAYSGAAHQESAVTTTPSGGRSYRWSERGGLSVKFTLTPYDGVAGLPEYRIAASWGVVVTVVASQLSPKIEIVAALPDHLLGSPAFGQYLASYVFETPEWTVSVGGPGDDLLELQVAEGDLPTEWSGLLTDMREPDTGYGFFSRRPSEMGWLLPPIPAGATVTTHIAVAWAPSDDESDTATWYAVTTSPEQLMAASRRER